MADTRKKQHENLYELTDLRYNFSKRNCYQGIERSVRIMNNKRHETILEIIRAREISTQEELQAALKERGFDVTQATVSRDIRRLRLVKRLTSGGKNVYALPQPGGGIEQQRLVRMLRDSVRTVETAQNILVIKTDAGMAMGAAAAIDGLSIIGIVGCIAGDDTIFAVLKTNEAAEEAREKLLRDLQGKPLF